MLVKHINVQITPKAVSGLVCVKILCKDLQGHLNKTSVDDTEWLNGCEYESIQCRYCQHNFERHELKMKLKCLNTVLKLDDLKLLLRMSKPAVNMWTFIGLELDVPHDDLKSIEANYKLVQDCHYQMLIKLQQWITRKRLGNVLLML